MKYAAAIPASNTPLSSETEIRCNRLNPASSGLSAAVAWIEPIWARNVAIFALTVNCEIAVRTIISVTHSAVGVKKLANVRVRMSLARSNAMPHAIPTKCIRVSEYPTMAPAWSRLLKIRNAPGATTKLRKTSLPSHRLKLRKSMVRRTMITLLAFYTKVSQADSSTDRYF